jgi:cell division septation protein DedD
LVETAVRKLVSFRLEALEQRVRHLEFVDGEPVQVDPVPGLLVLGVLAPHPELAGADQHHLRVVLLALDRRRRPEGLDVDHDLRRLVGHDLNLPQPGPESLAPRPGAHLVASHAPPTDGETTRRASLAEALVAEEDLDDLPRRSDELRRPTPLPASTAARRKASRCRATT